MTVNSSYSRLSYMAIKQQVSDSLAVKPDIFLPFLSENISVEYQPVIATPVSATRVANMRPVPSAIPSPTGNITIEIEPKNLGWLLKGAYGAVVTGIYLPISGASGDFEVGETITGGTSTETAVVVAVSKERDYLLVAAPSGALTAGETITGGTSTETAVVTSYEATRFGHEFIAPQYGLPAFTLEFGYLNEAIRYVGATFNSFNLSQNDNKIVAEIGVTALSQYAHSKITAGVSAGSGTITIPVDQTTGLVAGDIIKVFRPSTGEFIDITSAGVQTKAIATIPNENSVTISDLNVNILEGDRLVIAPQTPTYDISKELTWVGGALAKMANDNMGLAGATGVCIEDFNLNLLNELEPRHCASGHNLVNRFPAKLHLKKIEATGNTTKTYVDVRQYIKLRNNDSVALAVEFVGSNIGSTQFKEEFKVRVPNIQFQNFAPNISEDALLEQQIEYVAFDAPNAGYYQKALLVNGINGYA